jgi:hypothetical protein
MNAKGTNSLHAGVWVALGLGLLAWNGWLASFAGPFTLIHRYDGVQYQLLARNRLLGHCEVNDKTHTVGTEGRHPMWRPGLVWIEETLARGLGSVRAGAAAASALGTTALQLAVLWLAWCCFGKKTWLFAVIALPAPAVSSPFLTLAVGQGPEVWAAACVAAGLAALVIGLQRPSWPWTLSAGMLAGTAEWFRTGNILLFAVPCAVYSLAALWRRDLRRIAIPAAALALFLGMAALGDRAVPSSVNKTVANLWVWAIEGQGPLVTGDLQDGTTGTFSMASYTLVPGTEEIAIDSVICGSRDRSTLAYVREHVGEIVPAYIQNLREAVTEGFQGLRTRVGGLIVVLFGMQVLFLVFRRDPVPCHTVALAGGALAHYFGPIVLLAGDQATHYLYVGLPLFLVVAVHGAQRLVAFMNVRSPVAEGGQVSWPAITGGIVLFVVLSTPFYRSALQLLVNFQQQALHEQAAVNALGLEGKKVACRNMCWFVDQDVHTFLLPYATVPELERYVRGHDIDGILVWEDEPMPYFSAMPYRSLAELDQSLQRSSMFGEPQTSGTWRWYPVRRTSPAVGQARASY